MTRTYAMKLGALTAGFTFGLTALLIWTLGQAQSTPPPPASRLSPTAPIAPLSVTPGGNLRDTNDVRVYAAVKDAIVNITSTRIVTAQVSTGNQVFDLLQPQFRQVPAQSLGSGFVIHPAGYIITNEHVVAQGTDTQCVFFSGDKLTAEIIATDSEHDLAVLKVTPPPGKMLPAIPLGASEDLMIGEPVYAIGNPYGYEGTMTRGIVSAVNRTLEASPTKILKGLIQTDASINPGNSGGPLLNAYGQVIGINTAIRANAHGIGFAISVSSMRDLLPAFLNPDALNRSQVGFTVEEIRTIKAPASVTATVRVKEVKPGSNADKAGLKPGDTITTIGGTPVANVIDVLVAQSAATPGQTLDLTLAGTTPRVIKVPVTNPPPPPAAEEIIVAEMGVKGQTITPDLQRRLRLPPIKGVYVDSVNAGSPAAVTEIQPGDIIIQLGRYYITSTDDLAVLLKSVTAPVNARIAVIRGNVRGDGMISLK